MICQGPEWTSRWWCPQSSSMLSTEVSPPSTQCLMWWAWHIRGGRVQLVEATAIPTTSLSDSSATHERLRHLVVPRRTPDRRLDTARRSRRSTDRSPRSSIASNGSRATSHRSLSRRRMSACSTWLDGGRRWPGRAPRARRRAAARASRHRSATTPSTTLIARVAEAHFGHDVPGGRASGAGDRPHGRPGPACARRPARRDRRRDSAGSSAGRTAWSVPARRSRQPATRGRRCWTGATCSTGEPTHSQLSERESPCVAAQTQ